MPAILSPMQITCAEGTPSFVIPATGHLNSVVQVQVRLLTLSPARIWPTIIHRRKPRFLVGSENSSRILRFCYDSTRVPVPGPNESEEAVRSDGRYLSRLNL